MESEVLFNLGPIEFTGQMIAMSAIVLILCVVGILAGRNPQVVPKGLQNIMEMVIEKIRNFFGSVIGEQLAKQYLPFFATLFIFILVSNYMGLLPPVVMHMEGWKPPTSSLSINAGLAIIVFIATHYLGAKHHGVHYLKHFVSPYFFMLPFLLIEEIVRPISLSLRLFGNIYGEETVAAEIFQMVPYLVPIVFNFLGLLFGLLQALVFTMLAAIYISGACGEAH